MVQVRAASLKEGGQSYQKWVRWLDYLRLRSMWSPTWPCPSSVQQLANLGMACSIQNSKDGQAAGTMETWPWILILYVGEFFRGSSEDFHSLSSLSYYNNYHLVSVLTVSALFLSHVFVYVKTSQMTLIPGLSFLGHLPGWKWSHSLESNRVK